jgi:hypothetical protein
MRLPIFAYSRPKDIADRLLRWAKNPPAGFLGDPTETAHWQAFLTLWHLW